MKQLINPLIASILEPFAPKAPAIAAAPRLRPGQWSLEEQARNAFVGHEKVGRALEAWHVGISSDADLLADLQAVRDQVNDDMFHGDGEEPECLDDKEYP